MYDGQGNVTQNLRNGKEANSYYYDPFGKTEGGVEANDIIFGYNGEEYTESAGLQYLRQRHYAPDAGIFLTKDNYRGDLYEPASQDRYSYAENDPVNYNDPGGDKKTSKNPKKSGNGKTSSAAAAIQAVAKAVQKSALKATMETAAKAVWTTGYRAKNRNATKKEAETAYQVAKATGAVLRANETLKTMATKLQTGASCKGRPGAGSAWQGGRPAMPARVQDLSQLTKQDLAKMHDALDLAGLANPAADVINAALYLLEGDIKNAAISAVAVIPGAGDAVGIGRVAYKGGKYIDKGKGIIDAATQGGKTKPLQMHHFATDKNKKYTKLFEEIVTPYGLKLNGSWNKALMPHQGRHPNDYHEYVLDYMTRFDQIANGDTEKFLKLYEQMKKEITENPDMLYKAYWKNRKDK